MCFRISAPIYGTGKGGRQRTEVVHPSVFIVVNRINMPVLIFATIHDDTQFLGEEICGDG
jgi:hypothetical protein